MAKRNILHVVYRRRAKAWIVTGPLTVGTEMRYAKYETKPLAVAAARDLARAHQPSQVVIHKKTGQIERKSTYGKDPVRYRS